MPLDAVLDRPEPSFPVPPSSRTAPFRILVADDQREITEAARLLLTGHDFTVTSAASPADALERATSEPFDAALLDLNYGQGRTSGEQGLALVSELVERVPTLPAVVMTAWSSIDLALEAMRRGARDVVEKPWDEARLVSILRGHAELGRALRRIQELEAENSQLRAGVAAGGQDIPQLATLRVLEVEGILVRHAMTRHEGNVSRAARTLGLSRSALYRRLERHKV
jgi:DNA-binding NtrC family response regulator